MRLDTETTYCPSSLAVEPGSKIVEYDRNPVEPGLLKEDYMVDREEKHEIASTLDHKSYDMDGDPLQTEICDGGEHGEPPEDSICGSTDRAGDMVASYPVRHSKMELSEKETDFYTDKNVMEFELPELIVCFKESNYHAVKDICIDEGVPSTDKTLVENDNDQKKFNGLSHSGDENSVLTKAAVDGNIAVSDCLKTLNFTRQPVSDKGKEVDDPGIPETLPAEGGGSRDATNEAENKISKEMTASTKLLAVQDAGRNSCPDDSSNSEKDEQRQSDQGTGDNVQLANSVGTSAANLIDDCKCAQDFPIDLKEESGSNTYDFDSSLPVLDCSSQEGTANAEPQQSDRSLHAAELDDHALSSLTGSTRSFFIQHGHGESSFSGMGSVSGPIPYSGSISLRSDSSTASTRSFAFPILHSEWNSSPVKMAEADRRHYRKHRGWRVALLCCRF